MEANTTTAQLNSNRKFYDEIDEIMSSQQPILPS